MYHALYLDEILLNIFNHCSPLGWVRRRRCRYTADLAVLARTCQTFKEPALDMLWSELVDLSPLARCLPAVCLSLGNVFPFIVDRLHGCSCPSPQRYSICSPLGEAEWNTLRGYTYRVRTIFGISSPLGSLDDDSIKTIFNLSIAKPLFPNLRSLCWRDMRKLPLEHVAVSTLISLDLNLSFSPSPMLLVFLDAAADLCPDIRHFRISVSGPHPFDETISHQLCRWTGLQVVDCRDVALTADAIARLSSMSTLRSLSFTLSAELADCLGSTIIFSDLAYLEIKAGSQRSVMAFLSHIQLLAVKEFVVKFPNYAPEETVQAYLTNVRNTCPSDTPTHLKLLNFQTQTLNSIHDEHPRHRLCLDDILPCAIFNNLRGIHVNLGWSVSLTDADLVQLGSVTPCLEQLLINDMWGWRTAGGITVTGLLQLLRTCPSLYHFCLAIDARSFIQVPPGLDVSFPTRPLLRINVADSSIDGEYMSGIVSVFAKLGLDPANCMAWKGSEMGNPPGAVNFRWLWGRVFDMVASRLLEQSSVS